MKDSFPIRRKAKRKIHNSIMYLILTIFILLAFSMLLEKTILKNENKYLSVILLQLLVFIIPGIIYIRLKGENHIQKLKLRMPRPEAVPFLITSAIVTISGSLLIGIVFGNLKAFSGNFTLYETFISQNQNSFFDVVFLTVSYAFLPALTEELVFRSLFCSEYEKKDIVSTVIVSSLFFGLLHFNIAKLPIYVFSGIILLLTMYTTHSAISAIIVHFLYNCFAVFCQNYIYSFYNNAGGPKLFTFLLTVIFLLSLSAFFAFSSTLYRKYARRKVNPDYKTEISLKNTLSVLKYIFVSPITCICLIFYIITVIII